MACYLVACELTRPGDDYIALVEAIERLASRSSRCLGSVWLLQTERTAAELRDELKPHIGDYDRLLVAQVGELAWRADARFARGLA